MSLSHFSSLTLFSLPLFLWNKHTKHTQNTYALISKAGYEWVGWRNDSLGMAGKPVEMTFEFDTVRNFSSIILHTNNMFSKDVAVSKTNK